MIILEAWPLPTLLVWGSNLVPPRPLSILFDKAVTLRGMRTHSTLALPSPFDKKPRLYPRREQQTS